MCVEMAQIRSGNCPANRGALAMQEPVGKAILKILTRQLQEAVFPLLSTFPEMTDLKMQDTQDAISRILAHCNNVKQLMKVQDDR